MKLYFYWLSSYSQKVLIGLFEKGLAFDTHELVPNDVAMWTAYAQVNPLGKVPLLEIDGGHRIGESSVILEFLDHAQPSPRLLPGALFDALHARELDRVFDNYVAEPMVKIMHDQLRPEKDRDVVGVAQARQRLEKTYAYLDRLLEGRTYAAGDAFTIADCAAAPALGYARLVQPFAGHARLAAYFARLGQRPAVARVAREVEPRLAAFLGGQG